VPDLVDLPLELELGGAGGVARGGVDQ